MDNLISGILFGLLFFAIGLLWFALIKHFFIPLHSPKLSQNETFSFLENNNCIYIKHIPLNKKEKKENHFKRKKGISFRKMVSTKSEYKLIAYSIKENVYKLFWLEITLWWYTYGKGIIEALIAETIENRREIKFIEELDKTILAEIQNKYRQKIKIVTNKCPACNTLISFNDKECKNCGLYFISNKPEN